MGLIRRWLGVEQELGRLQEERAQIHEVLREMLIVSQKQAEAVAAITGAFQQMAAAYTVTGVPEGRHMSDEVEYQIFEAARES